MKILQHQYSGNILNISDVNSSSIEIDCAKRSKFIDEMKIFHQYKIDLNNIEKYIDDNIYQIAKYVYLKDKTSRDERKKILNSKKKLRKWLSFCQRAKPLLSIKDNITELWIISILQAILDHNDLYDYKFPLYTDYMKHTPTPSAVLKNDCHALDALQIYWVKKVVDYWYANIGRYNVRIQLRRFENFCDDILKKILCYPNCDEMVEWHDFYFEKINNIVCTKKNEVNALGEFKKHLNYKGFKFIDNENNIRHVFSYPNYIGNNYDDLVFYIDDTLKMNNSDLQFTIEIYEESTTIAFKLIFDYQNKICEMSEFKMITL